MKEHQHFIALSDYEHGIVIDSLNDKRTDLKSKGKYTDAVDELIVKIAYSPKKKFRVVEKSGRDEAR